MRSEDGGCDRMGYGRTNKSSGASFQHNRKSRRGVCQMGFWKCFLRCEQAQNCAVREPTHPRPLQGGEQRRTRSQNSSPPGRGQGWVHGFEARFYIVAALHEPAGAGGHSDPPVRATFQSLVFIRRSLIGAGFGALGGTRGWKTPGTGRLENLPYPHILRAWTLRKPNTGCA